VGECLWGCFDNCVGVLLICILVFTVFCIVCTVFFYCLVCVYLFLSVLSILIFSSVFISFIHNSEGKAAPLQA